MKNFYFILLFMVGLMGIGLSIYFTTNTPIERVEVYEELNKTYERKMRIVTRFEDDKYKVVCWQYDDAYGSGVSCIPKQVLEEVK